jgi:hypothetical protein
MLSIVFWRDNGGTRESGFDLKDTLASNLQLCKPAVAGGNGDERFGF